MTTVTNEFVNELLYTIYNPVDEEKSSLNEWIDKVRKDRAVFEDEEWIQNNSQPEGDEDNWFKGYWNEIEYGHFRFEASNVHDLTQEECENRCWMGFESDEVYSRAVSYRVAA